MASSSSFMPSHSFFRNIPTHITLLLPPIRSIYTLTLFLHSLAFSNPCRSQHMNNLVIADLIRFKFKNFMHFYLFRDLFIAMLLPFHLSFAFFCIIRAANPFSCQFCFSFFFTLYLYCLFFIFLVHYDPITSRCGTHPAANVNVWRIHSSKTHQQHRIARSLVRSLTY